LRNRLSNGLSATRFSCPDRRAAAYAKLDPWTKPLEVSREYGHFILIHKPDPRPAWNPALFKFTPADQFDVLTGFCSGYSVMRVALALLFRLCCIRKPFEEQ